MALFRNDVMVARARALEGEVALAAPLPWRICAGLLVVLVLIAGGWLAFGRMADTRTIVARVMPDGSLVADIAPPAPPPGACGSATGPRRGDPVRLCVIASPRPQPLRPMPDGTLAPIDRIRLRASVPIAPGARVVIVFAGPPRRPLDLLW